MLEARKWITDPEKRRFVRHAIITAGFATVAAISFIMTIVNSINYYVVMWNGLQPAARSEMIGCLGWILFWAAIGVGAILTILKIITKRNW